MAKKYKDKKLEAHPQVNLFTDIKIKSKETPITIGYFTIDGGFALEYPYRLVEEKGKNFLGKVTYYSFIKSSQLMSEREKDVRKMRLERARRESTYKKQRVKEAKEDLEKLGKEGYT